MAKSFKQGSFIHRTICCLVIVLIFFIFYGCDDQNPVIFNVIYNGNYADSGTVPIDPNQYGQGSTVTVLDNNGNLTKPDYTFSGWNTAADGTATTYTAGETFLMGTEDVTLYALWENTAPNNYTAEDYLDRTAGKAVKYAVTDEYGSLAVDIWAVSQSVPDEVSGNYDYITTLTKSGTAGDSFRSSTLGGRINYIDGRQAYIFQSGMNVRNQAHFYRNIIIPLSMETGDIFYHEDWGTYEIVDAGEVTINTETFQNCIRIEMSMSIEGEDYTNGTGYAILAPGIGVIQISFTRADSAESYANTTVTYDYIEHTSMTAHSLEGTVTSDGTTPAQNLYMQIATRIINTSFKTDSSGVFTLPGIYGPDVSLNLGYDGNDGDDGSFDPDYPESGYPLEYVLNGVTSDVTGLTLDLSSF